jgi:hypothetical protein
MQILALFLIEQMKVVATSLRQVWKWWQDDALTLILLQRIVLSEMVKLSVYHADFMRSGNQDAENLVDEWCTFLENRGDVEGVYFYAVTILTSDDFNCLGKALPKEAQMDTGANDENETMEDRVAKELAKRKERTEARKRQRTEKNTGTRG